MVLPGEEAQLIIEEVANLLRHSATSAGGVSADQLRRLDSNQSSLMSDTERATSVEPPSAGSVERPSFWGRLAQSPSAPMPFRGGELHLSHALHHLLVLVDIKHIAGPFSFSGGKPHLSKYITYSRATQPVWI